MGDVGAERAQRGIAVMGDVVMGDVGNFVSWGTLATL